MPSTRPSGLADPFDNPDYAYLNPSAPVPDTSAIQAPPRNRLGLPPAPTDIALPGRPRPRRPGTWIGEGQARERPSMRRRISRSVEDGSRRDRGRNPYYDQLQGRPRHHSEQRRHDSWGRNRDDDGGEPSRRRSSRYPPLSGTGSSPRAGGDEWKPRSFRPPRPDDVVGSSRRGSEYRHRDDPYDDSRRPHRHFEGDPDYEPPRRRNSYGQNGRRHSRHDDDGRGPDSHRRRRYSSADRHRLHHDRDRDHERDRGRDHDRGHDRNRGRDHYRDHDRDRDRDRDRDHARDHARDRERRPGSQDEEKPERKNVLKSVPWAAAIQAGLGAALDMHDTPGPWMGEKGAKVVTTAAVSGVVDAFFRVKNPNKEGGMRQQAVKVGLTEGLGMAVSKAASRGV